MNNQMIEDTQGLNRFYGKVYGIFALGLGISAVAAFLGSTIFFEPTMNFISNFPLGLTGLWIIEIILVILLSAKAQKNPSLTVAGFIVYSLINGFVLAVSLAAYGIENAGKAFAVATLTFVVMAFYGAFTKRDLTAIGRAGIGLLWGVIIASVVNMFLGSSSVDYFLSYVTVLIFVGLTAYDNQRIRHAYFATRGQQDLGIAAFLALQLYLDFVNLFLSLLRIFSKD